MSIWSAALGGFIFLVAVVLFALLLLVLMGLLLLLKEWRELRNFGFLSSPLHLFAVVIFVGVSPDFAMILAIDELVFQLGKLWRSRIPEYILIAGLLLCILVVAALNVLYYSGAYGR